MPGQVISQTPSPRYEGCAIRVITILTVQSWRFQHRRHPHVAKHVRYLVVYHVMPCPAASALLTRKAMVTVWLHMRTIDALVPQDNGGTQPKTRHYPISNICKYVRDRLEI